MRSWLLPAWLTLAACSALPAGDAGAQCRGVGSPCVAFCGSDATYDPVCVNGDWSCSAGRFAADCPAGTCSGPPPQYARCEQGQWVCQASFGATTCPVVPCYACAVTTKPDGGLLDGGACRCDCNGSLLECSLR